MSTTHPGVHSPTGPRCSWRGASTWLGIVVIITATTMITTATMTEVAVASRSELRRRVGRLAAEQLAEERGRRDESQHDDLLQGDQRPKQHLEQPRLRCEATRDQRRDAVLSHFVRAGDEVTVTMTAVELDDADHLRHVPPDGLEPIHRRDGVEHEDPTPAQHADVVVECVR